MSQRSDGRWLVQAHVPDLMYERLKRLAKDNERSISAELRMAIRKHLMEEDPMREGSRA